VTVTRLVDRASLLVLEAAGAVAADTTLLVAVGQPRVVILRHGPPDNVVFAEVSFPANAFAGTDRDSVRVTLTPLPGIYGLEVAADAPLRPGTQLVFKYAVHFSSPREAQARYETDVRLEEALFIGRLLEDGRVAQLPSTRPASDNLRAILPADGAYVVAAPR